MVRLLVISLLLLNVCMVHGQKYHSKALVYENCKEFIFNVKKKDSTIYNINATELQTLIKCKEKKFTLLYIVDIWCSATQDKMLDVAKFLKHRQTDVLFVSMDKDNPNGLYGFYKYFLNINYKFPIFVISDDYSKRGDKKLRLFLKELNPKGDYKNIGAGSLVLFDVDGNMIYCSDYTYEDPIQDIKKIINEL